MDYCSSKFAAVGIDDAIKVELKVQGHADYIKTTVVCLEWVVKSLKILFTFPPWILMLCRYFVKTQGFYCKFWKLWLDCITAMINSGKKWIFTKKTLDLNYQFLTLWVASMYKPIMAKDWKVEWWGIYARFAKNMADSLQLILTLILGMPILH